MKQKNHFGLAAGFLASFLLVGNADAFVKLRLPPLPAVETGGTSGQISINVTNLSLEVDAPADCVGVGETFSYTARIRNDGFDLQTLILEDNLSTDVELVSAAPSRGQCRLNKEEGRLSCSLGSLEDGGEVSVTVRVRLMVHPSDHMLYEHGHLYVDTHDTGVQADPIGQAIDKSLDDCVGEPKPVFFRLYES